MKIKDLKKLLWRVPEGMTNKQFDNLDVVMFNDFGMEHISEFLEDQGPLIIDCSCGECSGKHIVFGLITEDGHEELFPTDEMDEMPAMEELIILGKEDMNNNLN
jgi:hypothetical protein